MRKQTKTEEYAALYIEVAELEALLEGDRFEAGLSTWEWNQKGKELKRKQARLEKLAPAFSRSIFQDLTQAVLDRGGDLAMSYEEFVS